MDPGGHKAGHEPACIPEGHLYSKLHQKRSFQQRKGGDCSPLLCPCETSSGEVPVFHRHGAVGVSPEMSHKGDLRAGAPLL